MQIEKLTVADGTKKQTVFDFLKNIFFKNFIKVLTIKNGRKKLVILSVNGKNICKVSCSTKILKQCLFRTPF